ncbi:MAG: hypothetical protein R3E79_01745 [Caldilineaceae bacterium]
MSQLFAQQSPVTQPAAVSTLTSLQRILLLLLLLGSFALRLHALTLQNIWWDEAQY